MATPGAELAAAASAAGLTAVACEGVEAALSRAFAGDGPPPHVVICGSLHFIGDVLALSPETWPR
jgi:dihydrofolate synthase/folylpolyglutamate synthase